MTEPSAFLPPLDCGKLGKLSRPTLLVTGERSAAMFLLVTAELERCLEGERQVMVPDAGHGMHGQNAPFYNPGGNGLLGATLAQFGQGTSSGAPSNGTWGWRRDSRRTSCCTTWSASAAPSLRVRAPTKPKPS